MEGSLLLTFGLRVDFLFGLSSSPEPTTTASPIFSPRLLLHKRDDDCKHCSYSIVRDEIGSNYLLGHIIYECTFLKMDLSSPGIALVIVRIAYSELILQ